MSALEPLLQLSTPPNILKYVIAQFSKILPHDVSARRAFVTSSSLARVQEIANIYAVGPVSSMVKETTPMGVKPDNRFVGSKLAEYIRVINECYPEEIVRYYSPGYSTTLLSKIDEFHASQFQQQSKQQPQSQEASGTTEERKPSNADLNQALSQGQIAEVAGEAELKKDSQE